MAVRSMWKLAMISRGGVGRAIFYNTEIEFRSNPFSLSKVIESSSWFSHIHSKVKVHYVKHRPVSEVCVLSIENKCVLVEDFLKEVKVVQLSHPPYSPDLSPCDFFLFPLLKKTLSGRCYESGSALSSANLPVSSGYT